jgi:predicted nucleotidyltransferase
MREPSTFSALLARIAATLEIRGIPYMVIGGHAAVLYGEPRLTRDIDITLGIGPDRLRELLDIVRDVELMPAGGAEDLARGSYVLPCSDPATGIDVDLILSVSAYEQEALGRTQTVLIAGVNVRFASVEDVLIHKIVAGRPRDIEDARAILAKSHSLDRAYLLRWLEEFERTLSSPLVKQFKELEARVRPT